MDGIFQIFWYLCFKNNVSWGTRESPQEKTVQDLKREEYQREEALKEVKQAKKDQKQAGLMSYILKKPEGSPQKGGLEFTLANLFRCMLFTHDDPAAAASVKLVKIIAYKKNIFASL